ncbi:hypothetical protein [Streptomyces sp. 3N207]
MPRKGAIADFVGDGFANSRQRADDRSDVMSVGRCGEDVDVRAGGHPR